MALKADEMMMPLHIWFDAKRAMVRAHLLDNSRFQKDTQGLVNRGQRDRGKFGANPFEYLLRIGMVQHLHQLAVNDQPLMCDSQLFLVAELLKSGLDRVSHLF